MLDHTLARLYTWMLKLYPQPFAAAFRDEMQTVFTQALHGVGVAGFSPVRRRIMMLRLFAGEVIDLPVSLRLARYYKVESSGEMANPNNNLNLVQDQTDGWTGQPASWGDVLLGALPFILFGLVYILKGMTELGYFGYTTNWVIVFSRYAGAPMYLFTLIGLVFGWLRGFPRWSYAYIGMALYFGWYYSHGRFYGTVFDWRAWIPLIAAVLIATLIARSLRPISRLVMGIWNDWTRISFAIYAFILPLLTITFFDIDWGIRELYGLGFDTLLLTAGAAAFLRSPGIWSRVLSLQVAMFILVLKGTILADYYSSFGEDIQALFLPAFLYLALWCGLMFLPGLIGLLHRGVNSIQTR